MNPEEKIEPLNEDDLMQRIWEESERPFEANLFDYENGLNQ